MNEQNIQNTQAAVTRRNFLKTASVAAAGSAMLSKFPFVMTSHAAPDSTINVAIIGVGGRGMGALDNVLAAAPNVKIMAIADAFENKTKAAAEKFKVAPEYCFSGLDAYQKVLAIPEVNYVILTTPPGFRPVHFEAAVKAGKHIFCEKPVAVDAPGIRQFIAAGELAKQKGLCVVAGTQRHHAGCYIETIKKIQDGMIGDVLCLRAYWNGGAIWHHGEKGANDMEIQLNNWYHYRWLSGDHIVEQHLHNMDACNWVMNDHPIRAYGMGGRQALGSKTGHIYDHFAVEFEYKNGVRMFSQCRQVDGTDSNVSEAVVGTKGVCNSLESGKLLVGGKVIEYGGPRPDPQIVEHTDLIASIRGAAPYVNDSKRVAESTMTAIIGRESAYTGQNILWDEAMAWKTSLAPKMEWGPIPHVDIPVPGKYQIS